MNAVVHYLQQNREELGLEALGVGSTPSCVLLTPRFRASSHILALILAEGRPRPILVAKIPRLAGRDDGLAREAECLRMMQNRQPHGFDTLPRLVAFDKFHGRSILVETALVGNTMDPPLVRRRFHSCVTSVLDWLDTVNPHRAPVAGHTWYERLVEQPLQRLESSGPAVAGLARGIEQTRRLAEPLRESSLPLVAEHGDLSAPNVLLLDDGRVGVVDWESADLRGLPAVDLFFFLTYAACARSRARAAGSHVPAFHSAFFGPQAWARPYVCAYARRFQLPPEVLTPLFALCWMRYIAGLVHRLSGGDEGTHSLDSRTTNWLSQNRYWLVWRHTLDHLHQLNWDDAPS